MELEILGLGGLGELERFVSAMLPCHPLISGETLARCKKWFCYAKIHFPSSLCFRISDETEYSVTACCRGLETPPYDSKTRTGPGKRATEKEVLEREAGEDRDTL